MGLMLTAEELLAYTDGEREKWDDWFASHPAAVLDAEVQREGEYRTVWQMMAHIFLVERRHVERLTSAPALTESTGVREPRSRRAVSLRERRAGGSAGPHFAPDA